MRICKYCFEAIISHGEMLKIVKNSSLEHPKSDTIICKWCGENIEIDESIDVNFC